MKTAVLMTCHNRKETTLRCLRKLLPQLSSESTVFLVDDGSTDGTADAVAALPGVNLIRADGSLYWAKGMARAWQASLDSANGPFDGWLWLNDDVDLSDSALEMLASCAMKHADAVVVGELVSPSTGATTYGIRGDLFTGNFVYVPRCVHQQLGMICGGFHHAWADSDYAMRCKRKGVPVVGCGVVGASEGHPNRPILKGLTLRQRWALLRDPKGWCLHDLWLYRRRNWGVLAAFFSCAHLICHVVKGER